jgi:hypothetical protein
VTAIGQSPEAPEGGWTSRLLSSQVRRAARRRAERNASGRAGQRIPPGPPDSSPDRPILVTSQQTGRAYWQWADSRVTGQRAQMGVTGQRPQMGVTGQPPQLEGDAGDECSREVTAR